MAERESQPNSQQLDYDPDATVEKVSEDSKDDFIYEANRLATQPVELDGDYSHFEGSYTLDDGRQVEAFVNHASAEAAAYRITLTDIGINDHGQPFEVIEEFSLHPDGTFSHSIRGRDEQTEHSNRHPDLETNDLAADLGSVAMPSGQLKAKHEQQIEELQRHIALDEEFQRGLNDVSDSEIKDLNALLESISV